MPHVETLDRMLKYNRGVKANSYGSRFSMHMSQIEKSFCHCFVYKSDTGFNIFYVVIKNSNGCFLSSLTSKLTNKLSDARVW